MSPGAVVSPSATRPRGPRAHIIPPPPVGARHSVVVVSPPSESLYRYLPTTPNEYPLPNATTMFVFVVPYQHPQETTVSARCCRCRSPQVSLGR